MNYCKEQADGTLVFNVPKKEGRALMLAATGSPYLLIVQDEEGVRYAAKEGFDFDWLFDYIKHVARTQPEFKAVLGEYIAELEAEL